MRNFSNMFLRARRALEFSHGLDPKRTSGTLSVRRSGTNAGGDLELIFEQIGMDLIFFTPPPRDDGTSWALASPERH
jgi:hypothetical protein